MNEPKRPRHFDRRRRGKPGRGRGSGNTSQPRNQNEPLQDGQPPQSSQPPKSKDVDTMMLDSRPPLTEAVPTDTPRFADLAGSGTVHPILIQTITEDLKFDRMMPVQAATLHELLPPNRSECLVQAKTGTGKTIAFLLPAIQTMITRHSHDSTTSGISLLVISPTRELAMQIATEATSLLQRLPRYRVRIAIGGSNKDREEREILGGCNILVATPGRLLDHMSNSKVVHQFRQLDTLVLDEADRLLDMGFMKDLTSIVGYLPDKKVAGRQGMLFSATVPSHVNQVAGLVLSPGYKFISTIPPGELNTHQHVPQLLITVPSFATVAPALVGCINEEAAQGPNFKAIVFAPTAALADFYGHVLGGLPGVVPVSILHSRMSQSKRTKITATFRDATSAVLVATDVVARGMDFPGCTTIFQVGIPADKETYVHRLGRTARASAEGRGVFIICEAETWFPTYRLKEITFIKHEPNLSSSPEVTSIVEKLDDDARAKIYQAWLGYYKNHLKGLGWSNEDLVGQGNRYARDGLEAPETPGIAKRTAGKMGLRGTRGLVIVPDPPKHGRRQGGAR